jgi:hypothetical protein
MIAIVIGEPDFVIYSDIGKDAGHGQQKLKFPHQLPPEVQLFKNLGNIADITCSFYSPI